MKSLSRAGWLTSLAVGVALMGPAAVVTAADNGSGTEKVAGRDQGTCSEVRVHAPSEAAPEFKPEEVGAQRLDAPGEPPGRRPNQEAADEYFKDPCIDDAGRVVPVPHECSDSDWCKGYEWFGVRLSPFVDPDIRGVRVRWEVPRVTFPSPSVTWAFQFVAGSTWYEGQEYGIVKRSDESYYRVYSYGVRHCANGTTCSETFWDDYNVRFQPGEVIWMKIERCMSATRVCASWSRDGVSWFAIANGQLKNKPQADSYGEVVTNSCAHGGNHPVIDSSQRLRASEINIRLGANWYYLNTSNQWDPAVHYIATLESPNHRWNAAGGGQPVC